MVEAAKCIDSIIRKEHEQPQSDTAADEVDTSVLFILGGQIHLSRSKSFILFGLWPSQEFRLLMNTFLKFYFLILMFAISSFSQAGADIKGIEKFIANLSHKRHIVADESIHALKSLSKFYEHNGYQPVWSEIGQGELFEELVRAVESATDQGLNPARLSSGWVAEGKI